MPVSTGAVFFAGGAFLVFVDFGARVVVFAVDRVVVLDVDFFVVFPFAGALVVRFVAMMLLAGFQERVVRRTMPRRHG
jgi:hypothetical protein